MKVKTLSIKNFRGIRSLDIDFHDRMNVFIGENGCGKSAILDLLAILLSDFIRRLRPDKGTGRSYSKWDITNHEAQTHSEIAIDFLETGIAKWNSIRTSPGRLQTGQRDFKALNRAVRDYQIRFEKNKDQNLPVCIHYGVNRSILDIPRRVRIKHSFENQLDAYDNALTTGTSDFRRFFEWFRNMQREDGQTAIRLLESPDVKDPRQEFRKYRDPQLDIVNRAILGILQGIKILRIQRTTPQSMVVSKDGAELVINQLSDGEKCTLAMIGDLARRLVIANPSLPDPLQGHGVVMIDEIDLHLHPDWQRKIIPGLRKTFPKCQFILTTHSPQVLSHVEDVRSVFVLKRDGIHTRKAHPSSIFGNESNRILEDIMGVSERPDEIKDELNALFWEIDSGNIVVARKHIDGLRQRIGEDPELVRASVLIRRKEILGK